MVHILKSIVVYSKFMSFSYLEMSSNMNKLTSLSNLGRKYSLIVNRFLSYYHKEINVTS